MMPEDVPCSSGQGVKKESRSVLKDGAVVGNGKSLKNNISVRTGEEFSIEFLQECRAARQHVCNGNGNGKLVGNGELLRSNGNHHVGSEEVSVVHGLQRVDSVCIPNVVENVSAKVSVSRPSVSSAIKSVPSLVHQASGSGVSDDAQKGKIEVVCSSGSKFLPRHVCNGNGNGKVVSNRELLRSHGNHHVGYEEVSVMHGLQRVDSVCSSDLVENVSVKGSVSRPSVSSAIETVPSLVRQASGLGVSHGAQKGKIEFACSSGGEILPQYVCNGNRNGKVVSNGELLRSNGNHYVGYEELSVMTGLQRVDSACRSDIVENVSAKGSVTRPSVSSAVETVPSLVSQTSGSGVSDDAQKGKIKFVCSSGGKILPRPCDGKLRYVGGETRLISIRENFSWEELVKRTSEYCNQPHTIKYQLPGEDFDALISVSSNEDIQNMLEEYNGVKNHAGSQRLRIFLVLPSESESSCTIEADANHQQNPDYQYVVAVNGIADHNLTRNNDARNEASQLKSGMDQNPGLRQKQPPLLDHFEDNVALINSNVTSQKPLSSTKSQDNFPLASLDPVPQNDVMNGHAHVYNDPARNGIEIPVLKGRAFHSEKNPIPQLADPKDVFLGSDTNGCNLIPHAFSDPQLLELSGSSCSGSPDGNTLPSTLAFVPPLMPAQLESAVLQEKSTEQYDKPVSYIRTDSLLGSFGSESLKRVPDDANSIDEKLQAANGDTRKIVDVQSNLKENIPIFYQAENFSTNISSATANGGMNKALNVNHDGISVPHNLQVLDHIIPGSSANNLKPVSDAVMQQQSSNHLEKYPAKPALNSQRFAENQQHAMTGKDNGEQGSNKSCAHYPENALTDLLSGFSDNVSHEPPVQLPSSCPMGIYDQKPMLISSDEFTPLAVPGFAGLESPLCFGPSMQNPTTGAGHRREVSLMDDDFFTYTNREVSNMGHEEYYNKMQKEIPSIKGKEENQPDLVDLSGDVTDAASGSHVLVAVCTDAHPSNATEVESTFSDSSVEDAATDNESKDAPFSNAFIAEMEADLYGLQIIKDAELEELRELGSGTYGTVYHGRWRGTDVAIKRIKKSCFAGRSSEQERLTNDFWKEARILSKLSHPNVVAFYGVVPDGPGGTLATVTEFMANASLRNVLIKKDRSLDRRRKLIITMDAAFGMEYLHSKDVVHFDLKCDNLLVNMRDPQRPVCKVGDFGLSKIKRNTLVTGGVKGTLPWMAPELLNGNNTRVSEKVDVFSFGITMWEILTGEEPYANMHCGAIIGGIVTDTLRPTIPESCDPEWRKLMEQCWSADPTIRPSFMDIANRLRTMYNNLPANGHKKGSHL